MRAKLLFAVLLFTCVFSSSIYDFSRESFQTWKSVHGKSYNSFREEELRFRIFQSNVAHVANLTLNKVGGPNVTFAINKFADMTPEEFKNKVLMRSTAPPEKTLNRTMPSLNLSNGSLPESFDWRDHGAVTPVKDQGTVGTCWTFSTTGNIEGQWFLQKGELIPLSEEQIVECDSTQDPTKGSIKADCGVFGGWPMLAYEYVIRVGGIATEQSYPYCVGNEGCFPCMAPGYNSTRCGPPIPWCNATQAHCLDSNSSLFKAKIEDWVSFPENETDIAQYLIQTGPLSVALDASSLQFYSSGVWDTWFCSADSLDHAVLLVGFGVEKGWFSNTDFWTVKNSWGASWGEKGYFRIARGKGKCGINTQVTSALINKRSAQRAETA